MMLCSQAAEAILLQASIIVIVIVAAGNMMILIMVVPRRPLEYIICNPLRRQCCACWSFWLHINRCAVSVAWIGGRWWSNQYLSPKSSERHSQRRNLILIQKGISAVITQWNNKSSTTHYTTTPLYHTNTLLLQCPSTS